MRRPPSRGARARGCRTLANDTTKLSDAPTLYPLFGLGEHATHGGPRQVASRGCPCPPASTAPPLLWGPAALPPALRSARAPAGANVAQALGGYLLKFFSSPGSSSSAAAAAGEAAARHGGAAAAGDFGGKVQALMVVAIAFMAAALALHAYIDGRHARKRERKARRLAAAAAAADAAGAPGAAAAAAAAAAWSETSSGSDDEAFFAERRGSHAGASTSGGGAPAVVGAEAVTAPGRAPSAAADAAQLQQQQQGKGAEGKAGKEGGRKPSVGEIFGVLAASIPIRCLAVMSLAQVRARVCVCAWGAGALAVAWGWWWPAVRDVRASDVPPRPAVASRVCGLTGAVHQPDGVCLEVAHIAALPVAGRPDGLPGRRLAVPGRGDGTAHGEPARRRSRGATGRGRGLLHFRDAQAAGGEGRGRGGCGASPSRRPRLPRRRARGVSPSGPDLCPCLPVARRC